MLSRGDMMSKISASIICAPEKGSDYEIDSLISGSINNFHIDITDGEFSSGKTLNSEIIKKIKSKKPDSIVDVHLMVNYPSYYFDDLIDAGTDIINFHLESKEDISSNLEYLSKKGISKGLSIKADTQIEIIKPYLLHIDYLLMLNVEAGAIGGEFKKESYSRLTKINEIINHTNPSVKIISDGAISFDRIPIMFSKGAKMVIGGSKCLFNEKPLQSNISLVNQLITSNKAKKKAKGAVLCEINNLKVKYINLPPLKKDEVTIDIKSCGICGSDIERVFKKGMYSKNLIPGHEFSGIVTDANDNDQEIIGKRVAVYPIIPCNSCNQCKNQEYNLCKNYDYLGSRSNGGFSTRLNVPKKNLVFIPDSVGYDSAACIEPLAVSHHAINKIKDIANKKILILGMGPIGLLTGAIFKHYGASVVHGIDHNEFKQNIGYEMGFDFSSNNPQTETIFDTLVDCAGDNALMNKAIKQLEKKSKILMIANHKSDICLSQDNISLLMRGEMELITSWNSSIETDWKKSIELISDGLINVNAMISHKFSLDEISDVFNKINSKSINSVKVIINPYSEDI